MADVFRPRAEQELDDAAASAQTPFEIIGTGTKRSLGRPVEAVGVPYGSDASKLARQGVPSIIFGAGSIDRAHAAVEFVECDQVVEAALFFRQFIQEFV